MALILSFAPLRGAADRAREAPGECDAPSADLAAPGATAIVSGSPGPFVLIVGGIHGDEPSGALAAAALTARLKGKLLCGAVAVIAVANPGAAALSSRSGPEGIDLNRIFGDAETARPVAGAEFGPRGFDEAREALRLRARAILGLALDSDLCIDLHESGAAWTDTKGAAIVASPAAAELAMALIDDPIEGLRGPALAGAAPAGSLNGELAALGRVAITIEVPAGLPPEERIDMALRLVMAALERLGMLGERGAPSD